MPIYTQSNAIREGTYDHIIFNTDELELVTLLEVRKSSIMPNAWYSSDHMRIEAILQTKTA